MSSYLDNYNPWAIAKSMQKKHGWSKEKYERALKKIKERLGYTKTKTGSYVIVRGKKVWLTGPRRVKQMSSYRRVNRRRYRRNDMIAIASSDNHAEAEMALDCLRRAGFMATCEDTGTGRLLIKVTADSAKKASRVLRSSAGLFNENPLMMVVTNPGFESNPVDIQYDPKSKMYEVIRFDENPGSFRCNGDVFCNNPGHIHDNASKPRIPVGAVVRFRRDITIQKGVDSAGVQNIKTLAHRGSYGYVRDITSFYGKPLYHVEIYSGDDVRTVKVCEEDIEPGILEGFNNNPAPYGSGFFNNMAHPKGRLHYKEMIDYDIKNDESECRLLEMLVDAGNNQSVSIQFWKDVDTYGLYEAFLYLKGYAEEGLWRGNINSVKNQVNKLMRRHGRTTFVSNPGLEYHPPRPGYPTKMLKDGGRSYSENAGASASLNIRKQKIPIEEFERMLKERGTPEQIAIYEKTKAAYKRFHHGSSPKYVVRRVVDVGAGKDIIGTSFTYSMGKSPFDSYITPKGSKKGDNTPYLHEWSTQPDALATADGKIVMKPLDGSAKITDWMHG